MSPRVYYTDCDFPSVEIEREVLARVGAELVVASCRSEEDVASQCRDADGLLVQYAPIGSTALAALDRCRVVVRTGIGLDVINLPAATERGVCVANVPDYCVPEVSDHALALVLACARRVVQLDRAVRAGVWAATKTGKGIQRMEEQTVGVVGYGRIGQRLGRHARALGFRVLAFDPYLPAATISANGGQPSSLEEVVSQSDYVVVCCPLTEQTHHLIDGACLRRMKADAFLVNTSRGPVVDEAALVAALRAGIIAGAALDVLEMEPPGPDNPLLRMDNVIITPHAAFYSERAIVELKSRAAAEVARVLGGRYPKSLANPQVKDRLRALGRDLAEDRSFDLPG